MLYSCIACAGAQQIVTVPGEPLNFGNAKSALTKYHDCGEPDCYLPQLQRQIDKASEFLHDSVAKAKPGEHLAVVFDVDDTTLSTWSVIIHDNFEYVPNDSNWCITLHCNIAIVPTLHLYQEVVKLGVAVFFITGRPETQLDDTVVTLRNAGYNKWEKIFLRPVNHPADQTVSDYKSAARGEISQKYRIVLNVGDQLSDLTGPHPADHSVKLPNPFYYVP